MKKQAVSKAWVLAREKQQVHEKILAMLFMGLIALALVLSGCMPMKDENVNTELFKNKEDMRAKVLQLEKGMTKTATFEKLGVAPEYFEHLNTEQIQFYVYGNSQVQGTPEQLEKFKRMIQAYDGYMLPYRQIKSDGTFVVTKMKVKKTGHDLRLVLIFEHDKLMRATVEGTPKVNEKEDQHLWGTIMKRGIAAAF